MTAKIRALEKQALEYAADTLADSEQGGIPEFNRLFTTKFAELIVSDVCGVYAAIDNGNEVEGTSNFLKAVKRRYKGAI